MKKAIAVICLASVGLIFTSGCTQKNVEGVVISVPMSLSLNELMSGNVENITFTGDVVKVRLDSGEEVDAIATHEQMQQVFEGKKKATLARAKDEAHEGVEWKVINLDENTENKEQ